MHKQLRDYINLSRKKFVKKTGKEEIHDFTKKAIIALNMWELKPKKAELPICDTDNNIGTAIDAICTNTRKEIVLVEWKCGFDGYFEKGNEYMAAPLGGVLNSPLNQAFCQIIIEAEILRRFYNTDVKCLYVIQINKSGIYPHIVPDNFLALSTIIYDTLIGSFVANKKAHKHWIK